jgi:hypothetical protein
MFPTTAMLKIKVHLVKKIDCRRITTPPSRVIGVRGWPLLLAALYGKISKMLISSAIYYIFPKIPRRMVYHEHQGPGGR